MPVISSVGGMSEMLKFHLSFLYFQLHSFLPVNLKNLLIAKNDWFRLLPSGGDVS